MEQGWRRCCFVVELVVVNVVFVVKCCCCDHEVHGEIGGCLVVLLPRAWRKAESMVVGGDVVLLSCVW